MSDAVRARQWIIAPPDPRRGEWADRLRISPITAQILLNRGLADLDAAHRYLWPSWEKLHDPDLLPDMDLVAERLHRAITAGEKIVVYGDYDVDGIAGTTVLWHCLKLAGANVDYYVPHRVEEGYGLHADALRELAAGGARVVVTVDCGITAHAAAEAAREIGLDLLITDHHTPAETLPAVLRVINPKRADSRYPDQELCGAGVAFKLAWAVARKVSKSPKVSPAFREFLVSAAGLVGLATIADVVPLALENRILAGKGLPALAESVNPGIRALLASAGLTDKVDDYDAGYRLGPRLNAAGRMGHAKLAVEMLTTASPERAAEIAKYLEGQNDQRRKEEQGILFHAREKIKKGRADLDNDRSLVLYDEEWHPGVVGIVAGRLAEEFGRPTVLLWMKDGLAGGSARSVEGFNLHDALMACKGHTTSCGGHAAAGGLKLSADNVPAFAAAFHEFCRGRVTDEQMQPKLKIDAEVILPALNESLVTEFDRLAPFGNNNPRPLLTATDVKVMGEAKKIKDAHLSFYANQGGRGFRCIFWRRADLAAKISNGSTVSLAFSPKINEFNGRTSVELEIKDLRLP